MKKPHPAFRYTIGTLFGALDLVGVFMGVSSVDELIRDVGHFYKNGTIPPREQPTPKHK